MAAILIVDDEHYVRLAVKKILEKAGHSCTTASDSAEARACLNEKFFDLILSDINMPGESGLELLKHIKAEYPDSAVVMMTVIDDPAIADTAINLGAYDYITKPFESNELVIHVNNALRRRGLEMENLAHREKLESLVQERTAAFQESEKRYRRLVETMNEGLASIDPDRRFLLVNQRFCQMLGYTEQELIGRPMEDFVEETEKEKLLQELAKRPLGLEDRYEIIWKTKEGKRVYTQISPAAMFDDRRNYLGGFGVVTDITERKLTEARIKRELEINTALAETAGLLVSAAPLEEIPSLILEQARKLTSSEYGFVGHIEDRTGYLIVPTLTGDIWEVCQVQNKDLVFKEFGGLWGWVLKNREPLLTNSPDDDPRSSGIPKGHVPIRSFLGIPAILGDTLVGMIGLANTAQAYTDQDLGIAQTLAALYAMALERRKHEEQTAQSEKRLRSIIDSISAGILIVDASNQIILDVNPLAEKMIERPRGEIVGRECWNFVCPVDKNCCPLTDYGQTIINEEKTLLTANGREIPIIKTVVPIDLDGRSCLLETFIDISERKIMEANLVQAQKLESLGRLAAGIAHEINTPTQFIHSNVEFLEDIFKQLTGLLQIWQKHLEKSDREPGDPAVLQACREALAETDLDYLAAEIPEAVAGALEGVMRITKIVESMRYFAHPGKQEKTIIDVNQALENALTISRNHWKYCAESHLDLDESLPSFKAYAAEFNQVLLNLIINAADAITEAIGTNPRERGEIRVASSYNDGHIEIRISDTGCGIPPEIRPQIFDPFFTTKDVGKGTGQGLALAYSVVEKHGGTIDFESEIGRGTTFFLRFPADSEID